MERVMHAAPGRARCARLQGGEGPLAGMPKPGSIQDDQHMCAKLVRAPTGPPPEASPGRAEWHGGCLREKGWLPNLAPHSDHHRLPELFCGMQRSDGMRPVAYPVSCSPQAWAS